MLIEQEKGKILLEKKKSRFFLLMFIGGNAKTLNNIKTSQTLLLFQTEIQGRIDWSADSDFYPFISKL